MKQSLVTISIPTFNSEPFLPLCLDAIKQQDYSPIEISIIDGYSTDRTLKIAAKYGITKINQSDKALLGARYEGVKHAKGEYILLLDSDQILEKTAIRRAVELFQNDKLEMLVLEEGVYKPRNFIEKLFEEDRKLVHQVKDFSPYTGVLLPRFYRTELLKRAMGDIPSEVLNEVGGQDHAIIYFEAWKRSKRVGFLTNAVKHIEPDSLTKIWKKFYRWGSTSLTAHFGQYDELLAKKERFRTGLFRRGHIKASFASIILLLLKGVPYKVGYYSAKLKHHEK